jgi:putative tricarboxylic transport membrane protein
MALFASCSTDLLSNLVLILGAGVVAGLALHLGPAELCALALFSLAVIVLVATRSPSRGLISLALGLLLATIGQDLFSATDRLAFGQPELLPGINLIPLMVGLFMLPEAFQRIIAGRPASAPASAPRQRLEELTRQEYRAALGNITQGGLVGVVLGIIPGIGAAPAAFLSYSLARQRSPQPQQFGKGSLHGLAAAEAGNSGVCGATLIPLMGLGIPGDVISAVILGAFTLHGLPPGPQLFTQHQAELAPLFWGLILSTPLLLLFGLVAIRGFSRLSLLPEWALYPAIVTTALFGVYSLQASVFDIQLALITGLAGLTMRQIDLPTTPLLIAFILGPLIEENLRRALLLSQGMLEIFIHSPFVWGCVAATLLLCFWLAIQHHPWLGKRPAMHSGDQPGSAAEKNKLCRKRKRTMGPRKSLSP